MLHTLNILAAHGDDTTSQLVWVIAVLVMSAIGAIAGKIKEKTKKVPPGPPGRPRPPAKGPASEGGGLSLPRPTPPRPMPRVPRGSKPGGDRPIGIPRPAGLPTLPQARRPIPTPPPVTRRPAERSLEPVVTAMSGMTERPRPANDVVGTPPAAKAAASRQKRVASRGLMLSPGRLREAIVLKEVIGPPMSMREDDRQF